MTYLAYLAIGIPLLLLEPKQIADVPYPEHFWVWGWALFYGAFGFIYGFRAGQT